MTHSGRIEQNSINNMRGCDQIRSCQIPTDIYSSFPEFTILQQVSDISFVIFGVCLTVSLSISILFNLAG